MTRSKQTIQAENLYNITLGYKLMCKEIGLKWICKDKNFVIGCYACQVNRILKDYGSLIDDLKSFIEFDIKWKNKK